MGLMLCLPLKFCTRCTTVHSSSSSHPTPLIFIIPPHLLSSQSSWRYPSPSFPYQDPSDHSLSVLLQPVTNNNPWMLLYFISFLLIVSFFVLNMFVGVVVENFHKCRQHQEAEEARRREEKRLRRLEKKRRSKAQPKCLVGS